MPPVTVNNPPAEGGSPPEGGSNKKEIINHPIPNYLQSAPVHDTHRSYVNGEWKEIPVYAIDGMQEGHQITGPAILINQTSTSFVDLNWTGYFDKELIFSSIKRT